jgi:ABC-type transporter Mla maintaining outer membrane lipid asymmetry permease subunit MlaE
MNSKNFVAAGIAGGITDFLLGFLLYGVLFRDYFAGPDPNLAFIALGCLTFGFLMSYIFVRWANLVTFMGGLKAGAVIGFLFGLMNNFFMHSTDDVVNYEKFAVDVALGVIMGAIIGGVAAATNGALSKKGS